MLVFGTRPDTTKRLEALKSGSVHLVGTNHDLIFFEANTLIEAHVAYERIFHADNPYGDAKVSIRIVDFIR